MVAPDMESAAVNWAAALALCPTVTTYGYAGEWRLPTSEEQLELLRPQ